MIKLDIDPWADAVARYSKAKTRRIAIICAASLAGLAVIAWAVVRLWG